MLRLYIDIDGTICKTDGEKYEKAHPIRNRIDRVNRLYRDGNEIVFWTARGSGSGNDWRKVTEKQLQDWGVLYHELHFGKPVFDKLIDDRAVGCEWLDE